MSDEVAKWFDATLDLLYLRSVNSVGRMALFSSALHDTPVDGLLKRRVRMFLEQEINNLANVIL